MRKLVGVVIGALMIAAGLVLGAHVLGFGTGSGEHFLGTHDRRVGSGGETGGETGSDDLPRDMAGAVVFPEGDAPVDPTAVDQVADHRLVIRGVGLDVPLGETSTVGGVVNPPGYRSAYVVRDLGGPGGTTFIAMHSLRGGGRAPGNAVFDVSTGRVLVEAGDEIRAGDALYRTIRTLVVPTPELARHPDVWADEPGRLAIITCLQNPQDTPSVHRVVIIAQQIGRAPHEASGPAPVGEPFDLGCGV